MSDLIADSVKKAKVCAQRFFFSFFFSDPCLSRRWKTEQQKASRLKNRVCMQAWKPTQAVSKVFQDIKKKKKKNEGEKKALCGEVSVFLL